MSLLAHLSSQVGERTEAANRAAAADCLQHPELLVEVASGLAGSNAALTGDCAEVMTMVAEHAPELVAPYAPALAPLLAHPATRARWEAMHALALVADRVPRVIGRLLPSLEALMQNDPSVIVQVYAIEAVGRYAGTGRSAAEKAYPLLTSALMLHAGKHAARALSGLGQVARRAPAHTAAIRELAYGHLGAGRGVTRQAARALLRATEAQPE